ncbi:MAG: MlaD family protein [Candidatus Hydrogenedentota bacterium]
MRISNEFKVGVMVLVCVILFTAILIIVGDYGEMFKDKKIVKIYFYDAKGLKIGDPVFYAGVESGSVKEMKFVPLEINKETITHVEVSCEVTKDVIIRDDSKATISATLTGVTSLVIKAGKGNIKKEDIIIGKPPLEFSELTSGASDVITKVESLLDHLNNLFGRVDQSGDVDEMLANLNDASNHAKILLKDAKDLLSKEKPKISSTITNINSLTEKANNFISKNSDTLSITVSNLSEAIKVIYQILKKKQNDIEELITNLNQAGSKLQTTLDTLNSLVKENRADIDKIIDNVVSITNNVNALSQELRHRPWRLLHKPDKKERTQITIYDIVTIMSEQAEIINETVESLKTLAPQSEEYKNTLQVLNESLNKYQEAEKLFWNKLKESD